MSHHSIGDLVVNLYYVQLLDELEDGADGLVSGQEALGGVRVLGQHVDDHLEHGDEC